MKSVAIALNSTGIVSALFLYFGYMIIQPLMASALLVLSLIPILGLANKGFALVLLILNVCFTCASVIVIGAILFGDLLASFPLSIPATLSIIASYLLVVIINIFTLKEIAGVQQSRQVSNAKIDSHE